MVSCNLLVRPNYQSIGGGLHLPGTAAKVFFSEVQMQILEDIVASRTASVRLVQWAQIILLAFQKRNNERIAEEAANREIVASLSASRVGAFLKSGRSQAASP